LSRTKILLIDMPQMLRDIVRDVAARDPMLEVVGEVPKQTDLETAARMFDPQVIITANGVAPAQEIGALLESRPRTRVLTITGDGRRGTLYRLIPEAVALGDLSPESLLEAMHG